MKKEKPKLVLVNFKASERERAKIKALAKRFTNGVVSEYIRKSALDPEWALSVRRSVSKGSGKKAA